MNRIREENGWLTFLGSEQIASSSKPQMQRFTWGRAHLKRADNLVRFTLVCQLCKSLRLGRFRRISRLLARNRHSTH